MFPWYVWALVVIITILFLLRLFFGRTERTVRNIRDDLSLIEKGGRIPEEIQKESITPEEDDEFDEEDFYRCYHPYLGNVSQGEKLCRKFLKKYFNLPFRSCKPSYLKNPETGACLEYDCYEGSLKLAVEYQGKQHYEYVPHFHRNGVRDFNEQQRKDALKVKLSEKVGVWLIRVPYTTDPDEIGQYIIDRLPLSLKK